MANQGWYYTPIEDGWEDGHLLSTTELCDIERDIHTWGGDVNGGGHRLVNCIFDTSGGFSSYVSPLTVIPGANSLPSTIQLCQTVSGNNIPRWTVAIDGSAETGGNAGSNFVINRYSDTGALLGTAFEINRATGQIVIPPGFGGGGVASFNGRTGAVNPVATDYPPAFIGAVPNTVQIVAGVGMTGGGPLTGNVTLNAATQVQFGGTVIGTRAVLNFIQGSNVTLTVTDNPSAQRVDILIASTGGSGGTGVTPTYMVNGSLVGQQATLNLIAGTNTTLTGVNNTGNNRVDVTFTATGGGGGGSQTPWLSDIDAGDYNLFNLKGIGLGAGVHPSASAGIYVNSTGIYDGYQQLNGSSSGWVGFSGQNDAGHVMSFRLYGSARAVVADLAELAFSCSALIIKANTEVVRITQGGNVGIGTSSPAQALSVMSTASSIASFASSFAGSATVVVNSTTGHNTSFSWQNSGANEWYMGNVASNNSMVLLNSDVNGNAQVITLLQSGNVGINTASPAYKLDIAGDCNISGTYRVNGVPLSTGGSGFWVGGSGGAIYYNGGDVGIGTSTPATHLAIVGDAQNYAAIAQTMLSITDTDAAAGGANAGRLLRIFNRRNTAIISQNLTTTDGTNYYLDVPASGGMWMSFNNQAVSVTFVAPGSTNPAALPANPAWYVNSSGVGVGMTPLVSLDVVSIPGKTGIRTGGIELQSYQINNSWIAENTYYNGSSWVYRNSGAGTVMQMAGGNFYFTVVPAGTGGTNAAPTYAMVILNGGNVGIATNAPATRLDVADNYAIRLGSAYISSGIPSNAQAVFGSNAWYNGASWVIPNSGLTSLILQVYNAGFYVVQTQTAGAADWVYRLSVTGGRVGIGTSNPLSPFTLHVIGSIAADEGSNSYCTVGLNVSAAAANITYAGIVYDISNNALRIEALTGGVSWRPVTLVAAGGNVGIGTVNPQAKLHLANGGMWVDPFATNGANSGMVISAGTNYSYLASFANQNLCLNPNGGTVVVNSASLPSSGSFVIHIATNANLWIGSVGGTTVGFQFLQDNYAANSASLAIYANSIQFLAGNTTGFYQDPSGHVGIATTGVKGLFDISATSEASVPGAGAASASFNMMGGGNLYGLIMGVLTNGSVYEQAQRSDGNGSVYPLLLQPNGGNVGIGTVSPVVALHIANGSARIGSSAVTGANGDLGVCREGQNLGVIYFGNGGNSLIEFTGAAFLLTQPTAIGGYAPSRMFTVDGGGNTYMSINNAGTEGWLIGRDTAAPGFLIYQSGYGGGGYRFVIKESNGFVGISTYTPDQMLTVAGAIHSLSGGFVFPDGTVQATAASGSPISVSNQPGFALNTVYQNTTGRPVHISINVNVGTNAGGAALCDTQTTPTTTIHTLFAGTQSYMSCSFWVLPGYYWWFQIQSGTVNLLHITQSY